MTDAQRKKVSDAKKGSIPHNKGGTSPHKGKSYEEIYGIEKAAELRKSRSESNSNRRYSDDTKN